MTISLSSLASGRRTTAKSATLATYLTVWKQRRELANLDPARLIDLGITPAEAAKEAARPIWDLPCDH